MYLGLRRRKYIMKFAVFNTVYIFNGTSNGKISKTKVVYFGNGYKIKCSFSKFDIEFEHNIEITLILPYFLTLGSLKTGKE